MGIAMKITFVDDKNHKRERDVIFGRFAEELYQELSRMDYIQRLGRVPQLGAIKVPVKKKKTRLDYMNLQFYIHDVLKRNAADKRFSYTYNSLISKSDEGMDEIKMNGNRLSTLDVIQIMIMVANIGCFCNTFATNIGILEACREDNIIRTWLLNQMEDEYRDIIQQLITQNDYLHFNLGMSLYILETCNQQLGSVKIAKQLVRMYLASVEDEKLRNAFDIYKDVRNLCFYAYDLPLSSIPLQINLTSEKDICTIFGELQGKYNNNQPAKKLFAAVAKLLGDTIYNQPVCVIEQYECVSKKVRNHLLTHQYIESTIVDEWLDFESVLNKKYSKSISMDKDNILKLTFKVDEIDCDKLFAKVSSRNLVRAGYYYRRTNEMTFVIALDKKADVKVALKLVKLLITEIRRNHVTEEKKKYMNITKFFLYVLFGKRNVEIKSTCGIDIYVAKGRRNKLLELEKYITDDKQDAFNHELCVIHDYLQADTMNDTAIVIAGSLIVKRAKDFTGNICKNDMLNEYDGLVIYPYRKEGQVVFFEAKNVKRGKSLAKNCLTEKLVNVNIQYSDSDIVVVGKDSYYEHTI